MDHYGTVMFLRSPDASLGLLAAGRGVIMLEFVRPGWVLPAVLGCLMVVFGIHSLTQYPLEPKGLVLIAAGFLLCALEARVQAKGLLGAAAGVSLYFGAVHLVRGEQIHTATALATALPLAALLSILLTLAWRARQNKRNTIF